MGPVDFGDVVPEPGGDDVIWVEFEALEFEVYHDYQELHCYAVLAGEYVERYDDLEPLGERRWDIAALLGGENSRVVPVPADEPSLEVHVECLASNIYTEPPPEDEEGVVLGAAGGWGPVWELGSFTELHRREDWGDVLTSSSTGGDEGHSFQVQYRICADRCEPEALPAPLIHTVWYDLMGQRRIAWTWDGDESMISGFKVYVDGSFWRGPRRDLRAFTPHGLEPSCGQRLEVQMTAYSGATLVPDRESPPSNTVVLERPPCLRTVRVIFDGHTLTTHDFCCNCCGRSRVGPITGVLWANDQQIEFDGAYYFGLGLMTGRALDSHHEYSIETGILHYIARRVDSCLGPGCPSIWAPWDNTLTTVLDADEDLTYGVHIYQQECFWLFGCLVEYGLLACKAEGTIPADELTPGLHTAYGDGCDLTVEIEELGP